MFQRALHRDQSAHPLWMFHELRSLVLRSMASSSPPPLRWGKEHDMLGAISRPAMAPATATAAA
jgi:hypothetical protein